MLSAIEKWAARTSQGLRRAPRRPVGIVAPKFDPQAKWYAGRQFLRDLTPERIAAIFDNAEQYICDQIELAHQLEESDDHLRGTLALRRAAVLRLEVLVEPGDPDDVRSVAAAEALEDLIEQPWFLQASEWLLHAVLQQWAAAELLYENDGRLWVPVKVRPVEPSRWNFDACGNPRFYTQRDARGGETIEPVAGAFMVHSWDANAQPGDFALIRAVAKLAFLGRLDLVGWGTMVDQWATPFIHMEYAEGTARAEVERMADAMLELASQRILLTQKGSGTPTLHDVPDQSPHQAFQDFVRRAMSRLLLGQDSSQQAIQGQTTGATLQGNVRDDIRDMDAVLLDASQNETFAAPWCAWNFGAEVAPPRIRRRVREQRDPEALGRVLTAASGLGLRIPKRWAYQALGIQEPGPDDELLAPAMQLPGAAFGDPGVGLESLPPIGGDAAAPAGAEKVQDLGLNGAQIDALQQLLQAVVDGTQSPDVARPLIQVAFPSIDPGRIEEMVRAAQRFAQSRPTPAPQPEQPQTAAQAERRATLAARPRTEQPLPDPIAADAAQALGNLFARDVDVVRKVAAKIAAGDGSDADKLAALRRALPGLLGQLDSTAAAALLADATLATYAGGRAALHKKLQAKGRSTQGGRDGR